MRVVKRDGREVEFNKQKIIDAVNKAFIEIDSAPNELAICIADFIENKNKTMNVEDIQNMVEEKLMASKRKDVARAYIIYRNKRSRIRENNSKLMKDISEKINATNVQNQNANIDEKSFGGRVGEASDAVLKKYALDNCMSDMARENHLNNMIYIHDLNSYAVGMHNCMSIPYDELLANGFNTRQTDVRPANSVNTACQLVAVIFQLQSLQQFGGVSATHLDWTMIPYVRKSFEKHYITEYVKECDGFLDLDLLTVSDEDLCKFVSKCVEQFFMEHELKDEDFKFANKDKFDCIYYQRALYETRKEIYQGVEGLFHNLNTLQSRSGGQLPFTSINYGTCTEPEGRLFTKALLEVSLQGTGKYGRTSIFPCGIFQYMKGVNDKPGTPNYDLYRLALKSTSKRLYPNYANTNWSNQQAWLLQDRKQKQEYIDSLSVEEQNKLIEICEQHPEIAHKLGLIIEEE